MASRGAGARRKGAQFERDLANLISDRTGVEAKRGLGQTRAGGEEVSDVDMGIVHIEAKRHIRCNIKAALRQSISDANVNGKMPIAITKDDREPILCTMLFEDWILFLNAYLKEVEEGTKD
mgnify:CR=1 FL=1